MSVFRMLLVVLLPFLIANKETTAQTFSVEKVREQFFSMNKTKDGALQLFKSLENAYLDKSPVLLAYRGASSAASAGTISGVRKKLEYFSKGKEELEKAVELKPLDAEIRFLRLATQVNAPAFLGYNGDIKADKSIIIETFRSVAANHPNAYLYQRICSFMIEHAKLDPNEKIIVNQFIVKFSPKK